MDKIKEEELATATVVFSDLEEEEKQKAKKEEIGEKILETLLSIDKKLDIMISKLPKEKAFYE